MTSPTAAPDRLAGEPQHLHIVVVEDNPITAATMATLLRLWGHQVRVAADGPAGLEASGQGPPDVVLLDIGLPGMDGWELARRLHEAMGQQTPLLVAVTGYGNDEDRRRSHDAGIDHHLVKPVEPAALQGLLGRFQAH